MRVSQYSVGKTLKEGGGRLEDEGVGESEGKENEEGDSGGVGETIEEAELEDSTERTEEEEEDGEGGGEALTAASARASSARVLCFALSTHDNASPYEICE